MKLTPSIYQDLMLMASELRWAEIFSAILPWGEFEAGWLHLYRSWLVRFTCKYFTLSRIDATVHSDRTWGSLFVRSPYVCWQNKVRIKPGSRSQEQIEHVSSAYKTWETVVQNFATTIASELQESMKVDWSCNSYPTLSLLMNLINQLSDNQPNQVEIESTLNLVVQRQIGSAVRGVMILRCLV